MKTQASPRLLLLLLIPLAACVALEAFPQRPPGSPPCPCLDPLSRRAERSLEHAFRRAAGLRSGGNGPSWEAGSRLRSIQNAQELYRERDWDGDGVLEYGTLPELAAAKLIPDYLADGHAWGYVYRLEFDSTRQWMWWGSAEPAHWHCPGDSRYAFDRTFVRCAAGVGFYTHANPASLDRSRGIAGLSSQMTAGY